MKSRFYKKSRLGILTVFILCTPLSALAQKNAKDYFLPVDKKSKAIYNMPDANGKQWEFEFVRCYLKKDDYYEIVDTTRYLNRPIKIEIRTIKFTPTEVHLVKLVSATQSERKNEVDYDPPKIIMKVPGINQMLTWSYNEADGQKTNFVADWIKFKLNKVNTRAIRVTETIILPNGLLFDGRRIYYYMEGTGLWKMEGETRELHHTICEFVKLIPDSTVTNKKSNFTKFLKSIIH